MKKTIPLSYQWMTTPKYLVGEVKIADSDYATYIYDLVKENPKAFSLEIGYLEDKDGVVELTELSLVEKKKQCSCHNIGIN